MSEKKEKKPIKKLTLNSTKKGGESWDDTFRLMSWWDADKVAGAKVMVVGAGALGNEVLKNLALMNVGHILVVDFDTIEYANLCRSVLFREKDINRNQFKSLISAERIKEINPNVKVQAINGDIMIDVGLGVFKRMDVVIGCLDNRIARLFINRYAYATGKIWIDGAIENMSGQLTVYKNGSSCYECSLTDTDWANIRKKLGCADVAQRNSTAGRVPTTPISSSIIAAMQVQEALKVIHNYEKKMMIGEQFKYDGMNNWILNFASPPVREECDSHYQITDDELIQMKNLSHTDKVKDVLKILKKELKAEHISISLNYKIILEVTSMSSEKSYDVLIPEPHFSEIAQLEFQEEVGEVLGITKYIDTIGEDFPFMEKSLKDCGVPPLQILNVETEKDIYFVELTKDESYLNFE